MKHVLRVYELRVLQQPAAAAAAAARTCQSNDVIHKRHLALRNALTFYTVFEKRP